MSDQLALELEAPPASNVERTRSTSRDAAGSIQSGAAAMRARVHGYIAAQGPKGATLEEIARALAMRLQSVCARRWELDNRGLVRDSGHRRRNPSGRAAIVWIAT